MLIAQLMFLQPLLFLNYTIGVDAVVDVGVSVVLIVTVNAVVVAGGGGGCGGGDGMVC